MAIGDVYYSERANRFYQEGRRGAVGRDYAVRRLRYIEDRDVFIDDRGRTITRQTMAAAERTVNRFVARDIEGRPFVAGSATGRNIAPVQLETTPLKSNQVLTVRTVVTTPDGRTHVFTRNAEFGRNISEKELSDLGIKQARGALLNAKDAKGNNYQITSTQLKNRTVRQDYYVTTIKTR